MPHLYTDKAHGWRVLYKVFFLDGTERKRVRWSRSKDKAIDIYADVSRLESLSRRNALTQEEISYAFNRGYIDNDDAVKLSSSRKGRHTWNELRKKYEDWSRAHTRATTHKVNMLRLGKVIERIEGKSPADWTEEDVRLYIQKRKASGAKDWTVRHEMVVLRKLLDFLGGDNPARGLSLLNVKDESIPQAFTRAELVKFMRVVKKRRSHLHGYLRPVTLTYLYAGLRPSEIVRLTPGDVLGVNNPAVKLGVPLYGTIKIESEAMQELTKSDIAIRPWPPKRKAHIVSGGGRELEGSAPHDFVPSSAFLRRSCISEGGRGLSSHFFIPLIS